MLSMRVKMNKYTVDVQISPNGTVQRSIAKGSLTEPLESLLSQLGKGERRRIRKACRVAGMTGLAGVPAIPKLGVRVPNT